MIPGGILDRFSSVPTRNNRATPRSIKASLPINSSPPVPRNFGVLANVPIMRLLPPAAKRTFNRFGSDKCRTGIFYGQFRKMVRRVEIAFSRGYLECYRRGIIGGCRKLDKIDPAQSAISSGFLTLYPPALEIISPRTTSIPSLRSFP
jgi:hypothetical protein